MTDILSLDVETANYSYDIGGWNNRALFEFSVIATWDGEKGNIFTKAEIDDIEDVEVHDLHPQLVGDLLSNHIAKGGKILGHNILNFDLPVIKDSLDCWAAGDAMFKHQDSIIDTKRIVQKSALKHKKVSTTLDMLVKNTIGNFKSMSSIEAPKAWHEGRFTEVAEYCLKDTKLTYDLYKHMQEHNIVKSRSLETGEVIEIEIEW
jgi:predicted PolB exonuclease-like 3'-5' exonuclease